MTFLYLVPTGMNDPAEPTWGSWAGRYGRQPDAADRATTGPTSKISGTAPRAAKTRWPAGRSRFKTTSPLVLTGA